jgi:excisionase family DNA binding protein
MPILFCMPILGLFNGSRRERLASTIGTSIEERYGMEKFRETFDEIEAFTTLQRLAWGLSEVSQCTGLSVPFLRAEVRGGRLPVRRFGRRVLVRDDDLKAYLMNGSERESASS